jgi:phage portal protein BeeE
MLESRDFEVTELARFFGIPPYLMFQTEKSTSWGCLPGTSKRFPSRVW